MIVVFNKYTGEIIHLYTQEGVKGCVGCIFCNMNEDNWCEKEQWVELERKAFYCKRYEIFKKLENDEIGSEESKWDK